MVDRKTITDEIADKLITHEVNMLRFSESETLRIVRVLRLLRKDLRMQINRLFRGKQTYSAIRRQKILETLLEQTRKTIRSSYRGIATSHLNVMKDAAETTATVTAATINAAIQGAVVSVAFTPTVLKAVASDVLIQGAPSAEWWSRQAGSTQERFADQMRLGVLQGESVRKMAVRAQNVVAVSRREAEALVRTSVQTVNNASRVEMYRQNKRVIKGVEAIVTLDTRTSAICKARDGGAWNLETGKPLEQSAVDEPYPGPPPWHWNCRSTLIPITKSFAELGLSDQKEIPEGVRASMTGDVSASFTYEDWLKRQTKEIQLEALGLGRWKLWKEEGISLRDMVDQTGRGLTIAQIREKNGLD